MGVVRPIAFRQTNRRILLPRIGWLMAGNPGSSPGTNPPAGLWIATRRKALHEMADEYRKELCWKQETAL